MKYRLLDPLTALLLLLTVAVAAVWVRSYYVSDWVGRVHYSPGVPSEDHHLYLRAVSGTAVLVGGGDPAENFPNTRWVWQRSDPWDYPLGPDGPAGLRAFGIGWENERVLGTGETTWAVQVRLAWPASLFSLTTLLLALRRRQAGRTGHGLCAECGYDLRATPDQCPECGHKPKSVRPRGGRGDRVVRRSRWRGSIRRRA
ncbi:MAG TPA: hypothetical protein VFB66_12130 [Tepidisphaeraceae bacterium]|nr:hypothetical protein [Tepidisphaeraceae bacterium]